MTTLNRIAGVFAGIVLPTQLGSVFSQPHLPNANIEDENASGFSGGVPLRKTPEFPPELKTTGLWEGVECGGGSSVPWDVALRVAVGLTTEEDDRLIEEALKAPGADHWLFSPGGKRISFKREPAELNEQLSRVGANIVFFNRMLTDDATPEMSEQVRIVITSLYIYDSKLNLVRHGTIVSSTAFLRPPMSLNEINQFLARVRAFMSSPEYQDYLQCREEGKKIEADYQKCHKDLSLEEVRISRLNERSARLKAVANELIENQAQLAGKKEILAEAWRSTDTAAR